MGQRLNLEIIENGKVLANAYYHWKGYTSSSLEITQEVLGHIREVSYENRIINAVKLLEVTEAGLTDEEKEYLLTNVPGADKISFKNAVNRNIGLIAVSEKGIEETRKWEDARITIDLSSEIINFRAICKYDSIKAYEKAYKKECTYPVHDGIDFAEIPFDKFGEVKDFFCGLIEDDTYGFQTPEGQVWVFIK